MNIAVVLIATIVVSIVATVVVRTFARTRVVDLPIKERKIHTRPTPLLGGVAVIFAFIFGVILAWPLLTHGYLLPKHLTGVIIGALILLIGGALDDRYDLSPRFQIIFPIFAIISLIIGGIGIEYITHPFGGTLRLDSIHILLFHWNGLPYSITLLADLFTMVWLLGMMYTTKFLDGLDGLVSGIAIIGSLIIFFLSISKTVYQPETSWIALIAAGAFFGFLLFNMNPASIFLGESGSLFAGFILGVLAIISGGKIATALLIMGIPILDVLWIIARRLFFEKRSPFQGDRKHLHLRLVDVGFSQRQAVYLLYGLTTLFGAGSLFLQSKEKLIAFIILFVVMLILGVIVVWKHRQKQQ